MVIAVGCVLGAKVYFTIYLVDPLVGIYSILTSFVLFCVLVLSYFKYKDPYLNAKNVDISNGPLISIVVAAKNEDKNIRNCVQSCLNQTYRNKEIIVVNDGRLTDSEKFLMKCVKKTGQTIYVFCIFQRALERKRQLRQQVRWLGRNLCIYGQ